jgi:hypothetical protein
MAKAATTKTTAKRGRKALGDIDQNVINEVPASKASKAVDTEKKPRKPKQATSEKAPTKSSANEPPEFVYNVTLPGEDRVSQSSPC